MLDQKTKRNEKLFKEKESGKTFLDLSKKFKISPKRAREIYYRELKNRGMIPKRYRKLSTGRHLDK